MRELLAKWTRLEPDCDARWRTDCALAAVVLAIEARGWYWDARSQGSSSHRFYTCTVEDSVAHGEFGEPVTKPLLTAYLAALEAEGAS